MAKQHRSQGTTSGSSPNIGGARKPTSEDVRQANSLIYASYKDDPRLTSELLQQVESVLKDCNIDELHALVDPLNGIASRCGWPPTLYDFATFRKARREKIAADEDFWRRYPTWSERLKRLPPADIELTERQRADRKATVVDVLGYDPAKPRPIERKPLPPAIQAKMDKGTWSTGDLTSQPSSLKSPQMRELAAWCKANPTPEMNAPEYTDWHQRYVRRFDEIFISDKHVRTQI